MRSGEREIVVLLALLCAGPPLAAQTMTCHTLEHPSAEPGTTQALGINDYGHIVGAYTFRFGPDDDDLHQYGFVFRDGAFSTIDFPESFLTVAYGINNHGQIVGSWNEPRINSYPRGFLYSGGGYSPVDVPGAFFTEAFGINDAGAIVGQYALHNPDEVPGLYRGYMRSGAGGYSYIDWPDSQGQTVPFDVDGAGTAAGWAPDPAGYHGFLWSGGQFTDTLDFPGAGATLAQGINDAGQVVGFYLRPDLSQAGFIRTDGEYESFDCDGMPGTVLSGVNNLGAVVGTHWNSPGGPYVRSFYTSPTIRILPETTRWKPQRSDDPIEVLFKAPHDLESATLEIRDPEGTPVTVDPPPELEPASSPFDYRLAWDGPWTRNNSSSGEIERLPTGNYSIVVKGTRASGEEIVSAAYDKVSLVEVKTIAVAACGSIAGATCPDAGAVLAANPGMGGGRAAFPDAADPGGDFRSSVLVNAQVEPNLGPDAPELRVHFRIVDVDDPSAAAGPIDDETAPADNRGTTATITASVAPSDEGAAVAVFRLATRQGDNYRLAASTHSPWLEGIAAVPSSQTGEVQHASGDALDEGVQVSEMLTVWRTLHVELDRMDPGLSGATQDALQYNGTAWTRIGRSRLPPFSRGRVLADDNAMFIAAGAGVDHSRPDDWRGATLDPAAFGGRECADVEVPPCYRVSRNSDTRISVASGNLNDEADPADRRYYVRDDRLDSLTHTPHEGHDLSLLGQLLGEVYIDVRADSPNPNPLVPFRQNLSNVDVEGLSGDTSSSEAYWSVPLLLGFEQALGRDYDPTDERARGQRDAQGPIAGQTSFGDQPVSVVFTEAIRDFAKTGTGCKRPTVSVEEFWRSNAAHEVLHAMTLDHEGTPAGGLMCASLKNDAAQPARGKITDAEKARLRAVTRPLVERDVKDSCPSLSCN